ncbi:MAG: hypothetical protein DPW09_35235 [Anaerolineae bacterium]|nr:hypothetical protein [Anaerolineales bacterium]MCQ3978706.1 hypothetical protein [Anaerolineae bacterium]
MRLRLITIDWEYPENNKIPEPEFLDLSSITQNELIALYSTFANGIILEMKAEGDSEKALEFIRGLALGAGSCRLIEALPEKEKERLWLYEDGYECYMQGNDSTAAYIFVNPKPQPDIF